jgi:hypothetical protein
MPDGGWIAREGSWFHEWPRGPFAQPHCGKRKGGRGTALSSAAKAARYCDDDVFELFDAVLLDDAEAVFSDEVAEPIVFDSAGWVIPSALIVCESIWPLAVKPWSAWNFLTAAAVFGPHFPSTLPESYPWSFSDC